MAMFFSRWHSLGGKWPYRPGFGGGLFPMQGLGRAVVRAAAMGPGVTGQEPAALKAVKISVMVAAGAGLAVASIPYVMSTEMGLHAVMSIIGKHIHGDVSASKIDFTFPAWGHLVACIHDLSVKEGVLAGGQTLIEAKLIKCEGSPWHLITGKPKTVTVQGAFIHGGYSTDAKEFRLIRFLEEAGILDAPPPDPSSPPQSCNNLAEATGELETETAAASKKPGAFMDALCDASDSVGLRAELRQPHITLIVEDSQLRISSEVKDILGGDLHAVGAFGPEHLSRLHQTGTPPSPPSQPTEPPRSIRKPFNISALSEETSSAHAAQAVQEVQSEQAVQAVSPDWWYTSPDDPMAKACLKAAREDWGVDSCIPGEWQVTSPHLNMSLRVWEAKAPEGAFMRQKEQETHFTLLHTPAQVTLRFSKALSRFGLATVNPLLGKVYSLSEGMQGAIKASWSPDGMVLPYQTATMRVEPMCLALDASPVMTELVEGLKVAGMAIPYPSWLKRATKSTHEDSDHRRRDHSLIEACLSGQLIKLERNGLVEQTRVDMLIGPSGLQREIQAGGARAQHALCTALPLILWGTIHTETDQIDMVVGVPQDFLSRMGVHNLPPSYCLPIRLRGSTERPKPQLRGVGSRVTQLLLRAAALRASKIQQGASNVPGDTSKVSQTAGSGISAGSANMSLRPGLAVGVDDDDDEVVAVVDGGSTGEVKKGGGRVMRVAKWLLRTAVDALAPSDETVTRINEKIQRDIQRVPTQECVVPWASATV